MRLILLLTCASAFATPEPNEVEKLSEALGHLIGKNIEQLGLPLDLNALAKGMKDEAEGKASPFDSDDCAAKLAALQEKQLQEASNKNLAEAVAFLLQNGKSSNIIQMMEGKLQYKVEKEGSGETVQAYNSPLVRLKARYLDGKSFGNDSDEIPIALDETIPGFRLGLIGMKEGEIRTLYIHPDLGYGLKGQPAPNALLIFEVEVIRADSTSSRDTVASSDENYSL